VLGLVQVLVAARLILFHSATVHRLRRYYGGVEGQYRGHATMNTRRFPSSTLAISPAVTPLKTLTATVAVTIALAIGSATAAQAAPRYGVCRQQISDYVEQQLGLKLTRIEVQSYAERSPPISLLDVGSALAYVEGCSGFHGFEIRGSEDECEHIPHYGTSSGSYIRYEGAFEGCKAG
jgi:hypothetical protein